MDRIELKGVVPEIFATREQTISDIWLKDISFERGKSYLIYATSGTGKSSLCSYLYGQRGDYGYKDDDDWDEDEMMGERRRRSRRTGRYM